MEQKNRKLPSKTGNPLGEDELEGKVADEAWENTLSTASPADGLSRWTLSLGALLIVGFVIGGGIFLFGLDNDDEAPPVTTVVTAGEPVDATEERVAQESPAAELSEQGAVEVEETAEEAEESTLERARREGVIRVGFANEAPWAFAGPDGALTGEAIEVARAVFQELGIPEMEGVLMQFGSLIPGLLAGRFDVITAGMNILPNRCQRVLFADPEFKIGEALIVEEGNPHKLHSYEDIANNPNVTVGTGAGYVQYDFMLAAGVPEERITTAPPNDPSVVAGLLQASQIDAWTGARPNLVRLLETMSDPRLQLADPFEQPTVDGEPVISYGGAVFRYEDLEFRQAFNEELQALKDSGKLLDLIGQFEGFDEAALPGDIHAEDVCPDAYSDIP